MVCPTCEAEYQPGITRCPDDDTPLVERLTPENAVHDSSEARFVPLHKLGSPAEAEMVNDILQQNGVRSVIKSGGADAFSALFSATNAMRIAPWNSTMRSLAVIRPRSRAANWKTKQNTTTKLKQSSLQCRTPMQLWCS